jgi:hypothetical protein
MNTIALLVLLLLFCGAAASANDTVTVYQLTGTVNCLEGRGVAIEEAADLLRAQGIKVEAAEQRKLPLAQDNHCGAPTGEANVITVTAADWTAFTTQNPDAGGYGLWVFDEATVEVFMYDGTLQCGLGNEIPLEEMAKMLTSARIEVLESRKGIDGLNHIAVCGASTGNINVFRIPRKDLAAAQAIGFRMLVTRELTEAIKPRHERKIGILSRTPPRAPSAIREAIPLLW